jgi:hypothetical protein
MCKALELNDVCIVPGVAWLSNSQHEIATLINIPTTGAFVAVYFVIWPQQPIAGDRGTKFQGDGAIRRESSVLIGK